MKKVLSLLTCMFLISLSFWCASTQTTAQEEQEIKEVHIITDEDLDLLHLTTEDFHCDTCLLVSQKDAERLMKIAVVEDHTDAESQANVMACILNRVNDPDFPDTIEGVIRQKDSHGRYQFSTVANGKYDRAEPDVNSHLALAMIEKGEVDTDALYFESASAKNTWQSKNLVYLSTVGGTRFYK